MERPAKEPSVNFMGRLAREIMYQTDPQRSVYVECMQGWIDDKGQEVVGMRTWSLLQRGVGIFGLCGLDRLISFMIIRGNFRCGKSLTFIHSIYVCRFECVHEVVPHNYEQNGGPFHQYVIKGAAAYHAVPQGCHKNLCGISHTVIDLCIAFFSHFFSCFRWRSKKPKSYGPISASLSPRLANASSCVDKLRMN